MDCTYDEREGDPASLDWPTRLAIAMDVARGLSHMHNDHVQAIVHRDIKSANILLDSDFRAKIADFGLARMLAKSGESESVSAIGGTHGYLAPGANLIYRICYYFFLYHLSISQQIGIIYDLNIFLIYRILVLSESKPENRCV